MNKISKNLIDFIPQSNKFTLYRNTKSARSKSYIFDIWKKIKN